jgi:hypothetical protein
LKLKANPAIILPSFSTVNGYVNIQGQPEWYMTLATYLQGTNFKNCYKVMESNQWLQQLETLEAAVLLSKHI